MARTRPPDEVCDALAGDGPALGHDRKHHRVWLAATVGAAVVPAPLFRWTTEDLALLDDDAVVRSPKRRCPTPKKPRKSGNERNGPARDRWQLAGGVL